MPALASLPWYDLPPDEGALNQFWLRVHTLLTEALPYVSLPQQLQRQHPVELLWQHPRLVLSQCCGPDLIRQPQLQPIARPVFSSLDCEPGYYYSYLVVRKGFTGVPRRAAINAPSSRSGCLALKEWLFAKGMVDLELQESGAHVTSLNWLAEARVDIAAIDAHTWQRLGVTGFDIIGRSKPALTPPYVMHRSSPVGKEQMMSALKAATQSHGRAIGIEKVLQSCRSEYLEGLSCQSNFGEVEGLTGISAMAISG